MTARIIRTKSRILIVGPIYNQINKFNKLLYLSQLYEFIIINGNALYPIDDSFNDRFKAINEMLNTGKFVYVNGNYDYQLIKDNVYQKWIENNPNVVFVQYPQNSYIITCGGVTPEMNREILFDNLETSFISYINNESWHYSYGGGYGYIISNNPLTNSKPAFHQFSAQIGNKFSGDKTCIYAQEVDQYGLKDTILL